MSKGPTGRNSLRATYKPATVAHYGEFVLGYFLRFAGRSTLLARTERVYRKFYGCVRERQTNDPTSEWYLSLDYHLIEKRDFHWLTSITTISLLLYYGTLIAGLALVSVIVWWQ